MSTYSGGCDNCESVYNREMILCEAIFVRLCTSCLNKWDDFSIPSTEIASYRSNSLEIDAVRLSFMGAGTDTIDSDNFHRVISRLEYLDKHLRSTIRDNIKTLYQRWLDEEANTEDPLDTDPESPVESP